MRVQVRGWHLSPALPVAAAAAAALLIVAASLRADNVVTIGLHAFQDSRTVTVLSPVADLDKDFTDRSGLKARFGVDAITAASDSCARCHPQGANNQRSFVDATYRRKYGDYKLEIGGEIRRSPETSVKAS